MSQDYFKTDNEAKAFIRLMGIHTVSIDCIYCGLCVYYNQKRYGPRCILIDDEYTPMIKPNCKYKFNEKITPEQLVQTYNL